MFGMSEADLEKIEQELEVIAPGMEQMEKDFEQYQEDMEKFQEKSEKGERTMRKRQNKDWLEGYEVDEKLSDAIDAENGDKPESISVMLWGWSVPTAWVAFSLGLTIMVLLIVLSSIIGIADWTWIGSFVVVGLGVGVLVPALLWVIGAPEENVAPVLLQGKIIGPWAALGGAVLVLVGGLLSAIYGLVAFIQRKR